LSSTRPGCYKSVHRELALGADVRLSIHDQLKQLVPGCLYYPHKIAKLRRNGEPELRILRDLVAPGRTAIDVGANRGFYSYALSRIAGRVEAFEPHPLLAGFARRKLGPRVCVHEVALSNRSGSATLHVPQFKGHDVHYNASIRKVYPWFTDYVAVPVRLATLDEFGFDDVAFIKIDAEGSDLEVIEGAQETIDRHRPNMVVELVAVTHADPLACIEQIEKTFRYDARIMIGDRLVDARAALQRPARELKTCNVVFTPN
jgi:FkbM family methyltransferase